MTLLNDIASDISGADVFYDTDSGFAQDATDASGNIIQVIMDNDYLSLEDGTPVNATQPRAWVRTSQAPARDEEITINSVVYIVYNVEPNTDGETLLVLMELS